eukprot:1144594-Pelagomonas_calceolata.AAC.3
MAAPWMALEAQPPASGDATNARGWCLHGARLSTRSSVWCCLVASALTPPQSPHLWWQQRRLPLSAPPVRRRCVWFLSFLLSCWRGLTAL